MELPDEFKAIRPDALAAYHALPPLRKRIALHMMAGAAHLTNQIHIERAEEIMEQQDEWLAQYITDYTVSRLI